MVLRRAGRDRPGLGKLAGLGSEADPLTARGLGKTNGSHPPSGPRGSTRSYTNRVVSASMNNDLRRPGFLLFFGRSAPGWRPHNGPAFALNWSNLAIVNMADFVHPTSRRQRVHSWIVARSQTPTSLVVPREWSRHAGRPDEWRAVEPRLVECPAPGRDARRSLPVVHARSRYRGPDEVCC